MPLFLRHRTLFIHIPKCGGGTLGACMRAAGDPPFLEVPDGSVLMNGHTPQHATWRELNQLGWTTPPDFRVVALVRHPVERVLSAYRFAKLYRPDLAWYTRTPRAFLRHFLAGHPRAFKRFDQHNLGLLDFLVDASGIIAPEVEIWPLERMDDLLASFGLGPVTPENRRHVTDGANPFNARQMARIRDHVRRDLTWYERRFPELCDRTAPDPPTTSGQFGTH